MPFNHTDKKTGDVLRSQDWNAGMQEILRLEKDKVDRKGDTITGALSIGDTLTVTGNTTIGTITPNSRAVLTMRGRLTGEIATTLILQNSAGGSGSGVALDFNGYDVGTNAPTARLRSLDDGNASSHLGFYTKLPGANTNALQERFRIQSNGNIGIGITSPIAKLDIQSATRTGTHPPTIRGLYITDDFGADSDGIEFRHTNGTQGIGFGHNTIYAAGSNTNQDLSLKPKGTGKVNISRLAISSSVDFSATTRQMLNLWNAEYGIGVQNSTQYFRTGKNFAWYKSGSHSDTELHPGTSGIIQMVINDGRVGVNTVQPTERLEVAGNIKASGTLYAGGNPTVYENYEIYLRGSAYESAEGEVTFLRIANISMQMPTLPGINTVILNPNGTYKNKATHNVYVEQTAWNTWADWVTANSTTGDVIAVASYSAVQNAPRGGSAETLLRAVGAVEAFRGRVLIPYALLFIRGQSGAVEVAQPYKGLNAHIRTTYYSLLNDSKVPLRSLNCSTSAVANDKTSTTSTDWVDVPNMTVTTTTGIRPVLVWFKTGGVQGTETGNIRISFRLLVDDVEKALTLQEFHNQGWELRDVALTSLEFLTPGEHTYKVQWKVHAGKGTVSWYGDTRSLMVLEL